MLPGINMEERGQLLARYKKVSSGLRFAGLWLLAIAVAVVFMPGWLIDLLGKRATYRNHSASPSLYQQDGIAALLYCIGGAAVIFIIIVLISGWFRLRKKLRS
jgi:hypothetical protein